MTDLRTAIIRAAERRGLLRGNLTAAERLSAYRTLPVALAHCYAGAFRLLPFAREARCALLNRHFARLSASDRTLCRVELWRVMGL